MSGLKFVNNVLHRPKKTQQFWYFVPAPGERVRPKWVELDFENLAVKWEEAQNMPRERLQKHLEKLCPASAINLDILDGKRILWAYYSATNINFRAIR